MKSPQKQREGLFYPTFTFTININNLKVHITYTPYINIRNGSVMGPLLVKPGVFSSKLVRGASHQLPWVLGEMSPEAAEPKPATKGPRPAGRTELGPLMALSVGRVFRWQQDGAPWTLPGWWLNQPIWKICDRQIGSWHPNFRSEHKKSLKPPPSLLLKGGAINAITYIMVQLDNAKLYWKVTRIANPGSQLEVCWKNIRNPDTVLKWLCT